MMDTKNLNDERTAQGPSRREVLLAGAKLLPYVVPVISTVLVQGVRTASAKSGPKSGPKPRPKSCPPGSVRLPNGKCKSPPSKGKKGKRKGWFGGEGKKDRL